MAFLANEGLFAAGVRFHSTCGFYRTSPCDFPVTLSAWQIAHGGHRSDGFVVKF